MRSDNKYGDAPMKISCHVRIAAATVLVAASARAELIWSEDFTNQEGKGLRGNDTIGIVTNMSGITAWSVSGALGLDDDGGLSWWMVTNGVFEGQDVGAPIGYWASAAIDIGAYDNICLKMDLAQREAGCTTADEYFQIRYVLDGKDPVELFVVDLENQASWNGVTWTSAVINASAATCLTVECRIKIDGTDEGWSFDNVVVETAPAAQPPVLATIGPRSTAAGARLTFDVSAADTINGDLVVLSASNLPPGAVFNTVSNTVAVTNTFEWASPSPAGVYTTTFYAVDQDGFDSEAVALTVARYAAGADVVWINELHYDNDGNDTNEGVEIAGRAGTDLSPYRVYAYNGKDGRVAQEVPLTGRIDLERDDHGALWVGIDRLQNGAPDGVALVHVDGAATGVHQFLSYEGTFMASDGPARGLASRDIGVAEGSSTPAESSLQLRGRGVAYDDFGWVGPTNASRGMLNEEQQIILPGFRLFVR